MHDLSLELLLIGVLRQIWQGVHSCADYYVVEIFLLSGLLVLVLHFPTIFIWYHARHCGVEFARRVNVSFLSKARNILLHFSATRELVKVFIWIVAETWELVQFPWHLQSEFCIIAPPNATYVGFLFEKCAIYSQALEAIHRLESSNPSSNDTDLLYVCGSRGKGAALQVCNLKLSE